MLRRDTELGQLLQQTRIVKGMSLEHVSKLIGVDKGYLSRIERGQGKPSRKVLINFANTIGVNPNTALTLAGLSPITEEDDSLLFATVTEKWLMMTSLQRQETDRVMSEILAGEYKR